MHDLGEYHSVYGAFVHGYLQYTTSIQVTTFVVEGFEDDDGYLRASDTPIPVTSATPKSDLTVGYTLGHSVCASFHVFPESVTAINNANIIYGTTGPNSNSVWRYIAGKLNLSIKVPAGAIGYSTKLPGVEQ